MLEVIDAICNTWKNLSERELETLLKKFGNVCRDEGSSHKKKILSDSKLAAILLEIASQHDSNPKILIEVISSIHNMRWRYGLEITDDIFQFLIAQTNNKKVNFYISIFITTLPQFVNYTNKWEYIMSIPNIAPKKKSINTFFRIVSNNLSSFPQSKKSDAVKVFEKALNGSPLHPTTVEKYLNLIDELRAP